MMNEMVERVAQAICENLEPAFNTGTGAQRWTWDHIDEASKQCLRTVARAGIAAMREPTEAMVDAADAATDHDILRDEHIRRAWSTMIDVTLMEDGGRRDAHP